MRQIFTVVLFVISTLLYYPGYAEKMSGAGNGIRDRHTHLSNNGFMENKGQFKSSDGQFNANALFLLNIPGLNVQLRRNGFSYDTYSRGNQDGKLQFHRVDINLLGANHDAQLLPSKQLPGVVNHITEKGTFETIKSYSTVVYQNVYPNIDLEFVAYGTPDKPVEYNFILHPGADPSLIRLQYNGANNTALYGDKIRLKVAHGDLHEHIPASWTSQDGKSLDVKYKQTGPNLFAFDVPAYDRQKTLIIDPTPDVTWATYLGGVNADQIAATTTDPEGNIYVTGNTASNANITTAGAYQTTFGGGTTDIFISKYSPSGQLLWSTYYGGSGIDEAYAIKWTNEQLLIGGRSRSDNMASLGAFKTTGGIETESILASFNPVTGTRNWGTYYGGNASVINSIDVDQSGNIFILGRNNFNNAAPICAEGDFTTPGTYLNSGGSCNSTFLAKLSPNGASRLWGTWVMVDLNSRSVVYGSGLHLESDSEGNVYVAGMMLSANALDANFASNVGEGTTASNGFLAKFSGTDGTKTWGRYYQGVIRDFVVNETTDQIIAVGYHTASSANPTTGFLTSFTTSGREQYSKVFGDAAQRTFLTDIALGSNGNVVIGGHTNMLTTELADNCSFQPAPKGEYDLFINSINYTNGERIWGTYFGEQGNEALNIRVAGGIDQGFGMNPSKSRTLTIASNGDIILGANTLSSSLGTPGAHQESIGGGTDGILVRFNDGSIPNGFAISSSTLSPMSQTTCILGMPNVINGNAVSITAPSGFNRKLFYQWQKATSATGPWVDMPGEVFKDLQPEASQTNLFYRRQIKINSSSCEMEVVGVSEVATVEINANVSPIANADGPQWYVCGAGSNTVALTGSATSGTPAYTYQWFEGSLNSTPVSTSASWTTQPITEATTYTLQVTDAAGCVDIDQVTIAPAIADAGPAKSICQGEGGVQIGTAPIADPAVSYSWTVVTGSAGSLSCTNCAQPVASPAVPTTYQLTVTVKQKNGTDCTTTSNVTVTPVQAPGNNPAFAGPDFTICKNNPVTLGGTADNTYSYTWTSGQFLSDSQIANPVFNAGTAAVPGGVMTYAVTATKEGCTFVDEVKVYPINARLTRQDDILASPSWRNHLDEDNAPGTTYSWSIVSGDGAILQTSENGKNAYLKSNTGITTFRRTVTLNGVSCFVDVRVDAGLGAPGAACAFDIITTSEQGCPKVFGATVLKLGTTLIDPENYNFSWSPAHLVDNPFGQEVTITSSAQATITLTVTNKYDNTITCQNSIVINPPGASLPAFVLEDKYTCLGTPVQIGIPSAAGFTYEWSQPTLLDNATSSNPTATVNTNTSFEVTVTEADWGCTFTQEMTVRVSAPIADASPDRAVCNGSTVTIGTEAPSGTNWTYSWEPVNAAWTNGTGPNDAQPQVLFAAGSLTFTLTVTDPLSGCSATDQVTLTSTINAGGYTGEPATICAGEKVILGKDPMPEATYQWLSNGTPIVSATTSQLEVSPVETTVYTLQISFPGCTTPMEDQVTVTVNQKPDNTELTDRQVCKGATIAIGFGAPGNPAVPAGVASYAWSPSNGLSAANVANPIATVNGRMEYTVTFTMTNGCQFEEKVIVNPTIDAGGDATICLGEATEIGTTAIAGYTYTWTGANIISGGNTAQPTVKPTVTSTYTLTVEQNGTPVCTDQVVVTVNQPAPFTISGNTTICEGGSTNLSLTGSAAAGTTWQWSPLEGVAQPNSTTTTVTSTAQGSKTYRLTQTNLQTGCSNYKEVVVVTMPNTIVATTTDLEVCKDEVISLPLTTTSVGDYSYSWTPSLGLSNAFVENPTVTASSDRAFTVTITDNTSGCQLNRTVNIITEECFDPVTLKGNVFHDANALKDGSVNSTSATPIPTGLYVTLVDNNGNPVNTVAVNPDGTYDFQVTAPGTYSVVLHQTSTGSTTPSLPAGWENTGENLGTGIGNDGITNGILTQIVITDSDVENANFGIQQPPLAEPKEYLINQPKSGDLITLDGTLITTGQGTSSPGQLTGNDPEDGTLNGNGKDKSVVITTLPQNGVLYYEGVPVVPGQLIPNYDPSLMTIELDGTGYTETRFDYAYLDAAGRQSPPAPYIIRWPQPLPVTLTVFEVTQEQNQVLLQWTTTEETNSDHFQVQRSNNATHWTTIESVEAQGNYIGNRNYQFSDQQPLSGQNLYRLKMVDKDGSFEYSQMKSIQITIPFKVEIHPNPAHEVLTVKVSNRELVKQVQIISLSGIQLYSSETIHDKIDISKLKAGIYILKMTNIDGSIHTTRFITVK